MCLNVPKCERLKVCSFLFWWDSNRNQCDQMVKLLVQYLAIWNHESLPKA